MLALPFIIFTPSPAPAGQRGCLACHTPHYVERGKCIVCHRGDERTDRKRVAHDGLIPGRLAWFTIRGSHHTARGEKLLGTFACLRCHTARSKGNRLAANLDGLLQTRQPREIERAIASPVQYMPDFRLADGDMTDLVNALLAETSRSTAEKRERPLIVHFQDARKNETVFEKFCGSCHRALTARHGGLGKGEIGPNLSGIFTPFFPATFRGRERWSEADLKKWLSNPHKVKKTALMQPVLLGNNDFTRLIDILTD
jgi:cytochrome c2